MFAQLKQLTIGLALGAAMLPTSTLANHVSIKAIDGSVEVKGELIEFSDGYYTLKTKAGIVRISASEVVCTGDGCPQTLGTTMAKGGAIFISGSDSMGIGLMPELLSAYATEHGGQIEELSDITGTTYKLRSGANGSTLGDFTVHPTISSAAFSSLMDETAEIGMATRRIRPPEAQQLASLGAGDMTGARQERVIGIGGLVMIVHPSNTLGTIAAKQVGKIYSGQITNWKMLGGPDLPIITYGRQGDSGPGGIFNHLVFVNLGFTRSDAIEVLNSNAAMVTAVNTHPGAIGFVEHASAVEANPLAFKSRCGIVFRPNAFALKTEEYPFISRLYLYNRADNTSPAAQGFLDYAISSRADDVVTDAGFIGLGILRAQQNAMDGRLGTLMHAQLNASERPLGDKLAVDLLKYDRLSTTIRFASGSAKVSNKGLVDLDRLVEYLQTLEGKVEISVVGFTDSDGGFAMNERLSNNRAQRVATALLHVGADRIGPNVSITTRGYSELSPAVCNMSKKAKGINRRVEIWVRETN